jgi:ribose transport system permease protein
VSGALRAALGPIAVLVVLVVGFAIVSPVFLTVGNMLNILSASSVLMVLALASTAVILTGGIDLSVGSTLTLCAFTGALLAQTMGNAVLLLMPVIGLACGLLNGAIVAFGRLPSFLVTLGALFAYDGLANYLSNGQPITLSSGGVASWFTGTVGGFPLISVWAILALGITILAFRYTRFGRYVYAVGGNERTARLCGVSVARIKLYAFMISGFLAGVAALLQLTRAFSASPSMGEAFLLPAIGAVVMGGTALSGGTGGPAKSIVGVLVIAILNNGMVLASINPHVQNIVMGVVVVAAVALNTHRRSTDIVK